MIHIESCFGQAQRFELFTGKRAATFVFMSGSDRSCSWKNTSEMPNKQHRLWQ
jgi:hypothetical protein